MTTYADLEKGDIVENPLLFNTDGGAYIVETPSYEENEETGDKMCMEMGLALVRVDHANRIKLVSFNNEKRHKYMMMKQEYFEDEGLIDFLTGCVRKECPECDGTGTVEHKSYGYDEPKEDDCGRCDGSGFIKGVEA